VSEMPVEDFVERWEQMLLARGTNAPTSSMRQQARAVFMYLREQAPHTLDLELASGSFARLVAAEVKGMPGAKDYLAAVGEQDDRSVDIGGGCSICVHPALAACDDPAVTFAGLIVDELPGRTHEERSVRRLWMCTCSSAEARREAHRLDRQKRKERQDPTEPFPLPKPAPPSVLEKMRHLRAEQRREFTLETPEKRDAARVAFFSTMAMVRDHEIERSETTEQFAMNLSAFESGNDTIREAMRRRADGQIETLENKTARQSVEPSIDEIDAEAAWSYEAPPTAARRVDAAAREKRAQAPAVSFEAIVRGSSPG